MNKNDSELRTKYIAVLEEKLNLAEKNRDLINQLRASETLVATLREEIDQLQNQLTDRSSATPGTTHKASTSSSSTSNVRRGPPDLQQQGGRPSSTAPTSTFRGTERKPTVPSSVSHASPALNSSAPVTLTHPLKRTRNQQSSVNSTPVSPNPSSAADGGGVAKKPKHETSSSSSTTAPVNLFYNQKQSSSNSATFPNPTSSTISNSNRDGHPIDEHMRKEGTGTSRIITCIYCNVVIPSRNRSRWIRHLVTCTEAPKAVRLQFDPDASESDDGQDKAVDEEEEDENEESDDEDAAGGDEADDAEVETDGDVKSLINHHVKKTGVGIGRKIYCNHCNMIIPSNNKAKWMQHIMKCEKASAAVKSIFDPNRGSSSSPKVFAKPSSVSKNRESSSSRRTSGALKSPIGRQQRPSEDPSNSNSKSTSSASKNVSTKSVSPPPPPPLPVPPYDPSTFPLTYPCEPHPLLPDGTANTERWRAWCDVLRFQIPGIEIIPATGVRVTKFKRLHAVREYRLIPQSNARQHHSSVTYAIPERLHIAFLKFMVPDWEEPDGMKSEEGGMNGDGGGSGGGGDGGDKGDESNGGDGASGWEDAVGDDAGDENQEEDAGENDEDGKIDDFGSPMEGDQGDLLENDITALDSVMNSGSASNLDFGSVAQSKSPSRNKSPSRVKSPSRTKSPVSQNSNGVPDVNPDTSGYTKYINIIKKMIPDYKQLSDESRKALKRGVKRFLEQEMGDRFQTECVYIISGQSPTYLVPPPLVEKFTTWARGEIQQVFPESRL
ncbi:hypothetical protein BCR33DRAFT_854760 [Rhizoclosmatium globosum]|uniref:Uncharacterized protein n=1 Tax=Rhizoclosmatium globosum TaxID=329046 RepID=A0A1Y2BRU6_9FUNG|nr:hypothetical protein BCR33DRAFT_854760 [Rhizoclosmatium globosum]|eukprot:ORY37481.1 hypothetical protein BCR33DRAFT_854760 [Rhizoclosmatium globosum]